MAKIEKYGGNPKVVVAVPEVNVYKIINKQYDFVLIASDGIFDRLST